MGEGDNLSPGMFTHQAKRVCAIAVAENQIPLGLQINVLCECFTERPGIAQIFDVEIGHTSDGLPNAGA